jgi:copper homeostasis protein
VQNRCALEIAVETVEAAVAAERGGADRVELCFNLSVGGLTPDIALVRAVQKQIQIPTFLMIRPRPGDFVYSAAEFAQMKQSIATAKDLGVDGLVLGILTQTARVDMARTSELVSLAAHVPVTFHRAFDETQHLRQALEDVLRTGASRILTSGGAASAVEGAGNIAELIGAAAGRITIVPGAGINAENIVRVANATHAEEFHSGLSSALPYLRGDYGHFEVQVRKMVESLHSIRDENPK